MYDTIEMNQPVMREDRVKTAPIVHLEIFLGTAHEGEIRVSCLCPLGADHTYEDGMKYLGPVDVKAGRRVDLRA